MVKIKTFGGTIFFVIIIILGVMFFRGDFLPTTGGAIAGALSITGSTGCDFIPNSDDPSSSFTNIEKTGFFTCKTDE